MRIQEQEFETRREALIERLSTRALTGVVLFDPQRVAYYTGFSFIPTERPVAMALSVEGRCGMLLPRLEVEHAEAASALHEVVEYGDYPGDCHPMTVLSRLLGSLRIEPPLGADMDGYPWVFGYRGPSLGDFVHVADLVEDQMAVKIEAEIALLRESARWAGVAHRLLQRYTAPGLREGDVSARATTEATEAMLAEVGPDYRSLDPWVEGAFAMYRGQIGRNGSMPHALGNNTRFQEGDVVVTGATAPVWGYRSELERTMVLGTPNPRQRELFQHMLALQETALDALRPGARCADVDLGVRSYFERHGLWEHWRHHTGHAIGLRFHEGPFLDSGDPTEIVPGMVFTVEPGLYDPAVGGFRHSDTVVVTESGVEHLTEYARALEDLSLPV